MFEARIVSSCVQAGRSQRIKDEGVVPPVHQARMGPSLGCRFAKLAHRDLLSKTRVKVLAHSAAPAVLPTVQDFICVVHVNLAMFSRYPGKLVARLAIVAKYLQVLLLVLTALLESTVIVMGWQYVSHACQGSTRIKTERLYV